ncbi:MAG: DUF4301 family protein [Bacteroidaceae bacterium]|nr:DUF4301 family protein [Bacteroidaceae bacterium]
METLANILTPSDKAQLEKKGISEVQIQQQLREFQTGFPFLRLAGAAAIGRGIVAVTAEEKTSHIAAWEAYKQAGHRITKFVPASGAASRMFKDMFEFLDADYDVPTKEAEKKFFEGIHDFAFFSALDDSCMVNEGRGVDALIDEGEYKAVVSNMLGETGLNYGQLPKGLLQFHAYDEEIRTPLEEHLVEAALYASSRNEADVHFTVSTEHRKLFESLVERILPNYEQQYGIHFHISFSEQKPSTDTMAANMDNTPFRNDDGSLLFRPGGHGALIQNLGDLESDVVFVKNIDNVVPDRMKPVTTEWKQVIAGLLVETQERVFGYLRRLDEGNVSHEELCEMLHFIEHTLCTQLPHAEELDDAALSTLLRGKLNRPMRVCGVVRNAGEPGGGPFLAYNPDGSVSPQILESSQIDKNNPEYVRMFTGGTHFNPVDLVCGIRDYKGGRFDLPRYVDPQTGFISFKSKNGRELKALELPGLWNGAMSDWSTLFVEVPLETFNPVKTVNDLLRKEHQQTL